MEMQEILVIVLFAIALIYVGRIVIKNFRSKDGCSSGCGKCGVDFSDIKIDEKSN